MNAEVIHPAGCVVQHTTIIRIVGSNGDDTYCALTTHSEGDQVHCAITRRIGSHAPVASVFDEASHHLKTVLLPNRKKESIVLIDDAFQLTTSRHILHSFEIVTANNSGVVTLRSVDLRTHEAWTVRVQPAVNLLFDLGA